jgi:hypothetical protein
MGGEIENLQFINLKITEISKIIFHSGFPIFAIIPKPKRIPMLGGGSIVDHLDNSILYIDKTNLKSNKKLQSITKSKGKYLLL